MDSVKDRRLRALPGGCGEEGTFLDDWLIWQDRRPGGLWHTRKRGGYLQEPGSAPYAVSAPDLAGLAVKLEAVLAVSGELLYRPYAGEPARLLLRRVHTLSGGGGRAGAS